MKSRNATDEIKNLNVLGNAMKITKELLAIIMKNL